MRWIWMTFVLMTMASGCTLSASEETPNLNFNILTLTPIHCEGDHRPVHCGVGNQTQSTPLGTVYANYTIRQRAIPSPYPLRAPDSLEVEIAFAGEAANEEIEVTVAVDEVGGVKWTGTTNVTKELEPGATETVSFPFEPSPGWPNGDLIFPRMVLGVAMDEEERWQESHLVFVMAQPK